MFDDAFYVGVSWRRENQGHERGILSSHLALRCNWRVKDYKSTKMTWKLDGGKPASVKLMAKPIFSALP